MNLQAIQPFDRKNGEWRVIVETPKGRRNKYSFDQKLTAFLLKSVLPEGMNIGGPKKADALAKRAMRTARNSKQRERE